MLRRFLFTLVGEPVRDPAGADVHHCAVGLTDHLAIVGVTEAGAAFHIDHLTQAGLLSWAKMGEDPYPTVVDTLGALTGRELVNGTEEDFVPIE